MYGKSKLVMAAMVMASFFDDIMYQPMNREERDTEHSKYCRALRRKLRSAWRQ